MSDADRIFNVLRKAKKLAQEYRRLTGKPLGITGEVAEYEAARHLGVTLTSARQGGYDATQGIFGVRKKIAHVFGRRLRGARRR